jgi:membrane protease YdiL (CAAX protease family)
MNSELQDTVAKIRTSTPELAVQILVVFIIPIVLINTGIIPIEYRVPVLAILVTTLCIFLVAEKWTLRMLGFRRTVPLKTILAYTLFTIVGVWAISRLGRYLGYTPTDTWWQVPHFLYLFFIVSAFQEIAYRGYLMPALATFEKSPVALIVTNAALFTFLHSVFPNYSINLPLAFVGGIGFACMYYKYPNMLAITLSHAVLNFAAVWYGFFTVAGF